VEVRVRKDQTISTGVQAYYIFRMGVRALPSLRSISSPSGLGRLDRFGVEFSTAGTFPVADATPAERSPMLSELLAF